MDSLGRFVIPKELREKMELIRNTPMEIYVDGNQIILRKEATACCFCDSEDRLFSFKGQKICNKCLIELGKVYHEAK